MELIEFKMSTFLSQKGVSIYTAVCKEIGNYENEEGNFCLNQDKGLHDLYDIYILDLSAMIAPDYHVSSFEPASKKSLFDVRDNVNLLMIPFSCLIPKRDDKKLQMVNKNSQENLV